MLATCWTDQAALLASTAFDLDELSAGSWTTLASWPSGDSPRPIGSASNGLLRCNGGETAWMTTDDEQLFRFGLG